MSSGMNMQEAKKVAERMSYRQAVLNCLNARCVPFRKATRIKMKQLLESIDNDFTDDLLNMGYTKGYIKGRTDAIDEINKTEDELIKVFKKEKDMWTIKLAFAELREQLEEKMDGEI